MAKPPTFNLRREDIPDVQGIDKLLRALGNFTNDTTVALSSALTFSDNFNCEVIELDFTLFSDTTTITPVNPWGQYEVLGASNYFNPPFLRKTSEGLVICAGVLSGGLPGTVAFQLAATLRPEKQIVGLGYGKFGPQEGALAYEIFPSGEVRIGKGVAGTNTCDFYHFNAVWPTDDLSPITNAVFPQKKALTKLTSTPSGVVVLKAVEIDSEARTEKPVGRPLNVDWSVYEKKIVIENIPGLIPSKRYKIKLLVLGS